MTNNIVADVPVSLANSESDVQGSDAAQDNVHRLHPLSLVLRVISFLPQFLFGTIAATISVDNNIARIFIGFGLLAGVAIFGLIAWLRWRKFTYEIGANEVHIKSGIIGRNNRSIPYERIQDVNIEQKLLARIFGLATLKLETGSAGNGDDGELNAVKLARAEELRDMIRARKRGVAISDNPISEAGVDNAAPFSADADADTLQDDPIFTMEPKRLLILGLFSFSLAIFAFLLAVFQQLDFLIPDNWFNLSDFIDQLEDDPDGSAANVRSTIDGAGTGLRSIPLGLQILAGLAGLVSIIIIGLATGIISVFVREYGFRLDRTENGFRRRRGLFTLTDVAMPLHRVQTALLVTGPIRRRFGWYALKFQSLASDGQNESDHVVAPLARMEEAVAIAAEPGIDIDMPTAQMTGVSIAMWLVPLAFFAIIIAFSASNAVFWSGIWWFAAISLLLVPFALHLWLRWRHHHYKLTEHFLYIRSGYWSQKLTALPLRKIQTVDLTENFIQRPLGQADLVFGIAGGSGIVPLTLHAIDRQTAYQIRSDILAQMRAAAIANASA